MAFLYSFHKNELKVIKGNYNEEKTKFFTKRLSNKIYFETEYGDRRIVSKNEGEVCNNQLWLNVRNDQKAIELLVKYYNNGIKKLESDLNKLHEQLNNLYFIYGKKVRN